MQPGKKSIGTHTTYQKTVEASNLLHQRVTAKWLSEQENTKMIAILQAIAAKVGADVNEDPHLQALSEETIPEKLVEQIEVRQTK